MGGCTTTTLTHAAATGSLDEHCCRTTLLPITTRHSHMQQPWVPSTSTAAVPPSSRLRHDTRPPTVTAQPPHTPSNPSFSVRHRPQQRIYQEAARRNGFQRGKNGGGRRRHALTRMKQQPWVPSTCTATSTVHCRLEPIPSLPLSTGAAAWVMRPSHDPLPSGGCSIDRHRQRTTSHIIRGHCWYAAQHLTRSNEQKSTMNTSFTGCPHSTLTHEASDYVKPTTTYPVLDFLLEGTFSRQPPTTGTLPPSEELAFPVVRP